MKQFICAIILVLTLASAQAGGTGNLYIYSYAGDPSTAAVASLNPPKGALVYDTTNNLWRLKTSVFGSNAGYDIVITGTAASTLANAVLTTPTITGGLITSATSVTPVITRPSVTGGLITSSTLVTPLVSATAGTTAGTLGTSGTSLYFYNGTAWAKLDN